LTGCFPGSRFVVSLPVDQQRVLDRIEGDLRGCEPRLVSMFSIFTRLTRDEGAPPAERLGSEARRRRTWLGPELAAVIVNPLILGLVGLFVFLTVSGVTGHGCRSAAGPHPAAVSHAPSCQSAQEPPGHGS
jgi:hypothetical protein